MSKIIHDSQLQQINFLDERFYTRDNINFYPSVTTVLEAWPKGYGFTQWLKDLGMNADEVVRRAADSGSKVHDAIDQYINKQKLSWVNEKGDTNYTIEEWLMILKFVEFWTQYTPKIIANELTTVSEELRLGGTLDLVCEIDGEIWLIDYKTSTSIWKTHELQLSAYATLWNQFNPTKQIKRWGIMHLKAMTRGVDKSGKSIQGAGWQLKEFDRPYTEAFKLFEYTHAIWDEENPNYKPKNLIYPDTVQLEEKK